MSPAGSSPSSIGPGTGIPGVQPVGPEKSSGCIRGCLIAAGVLVILLILVLGLGGWLFYSKSSNWIAIAMEKGKPEVMSCLTPDHSPEERAEFEKAYDEMAGAVKKDGFVKSVLEHENSWRSLQAITADKKIDLEESRRWVSEWNQEMERHAGKGRNP